MLGVNSWNSWLFMKINGGADASSWLVELAKVIGDGLIYLVPLALVALWLRGNIASRSLSLRAFAVAMFAVGLNQAIGLFWQHPRPFAIGLGHAWIPHAADSSFPSDHATVLFALAFTFFAEGAAAIGIASIACAFAVAWARVFLGVHFPYDMAGAALVAFASLALLSKPWNMVGGSATGLAESVYRRLFAWPISAGWVRK